MALALGVPLRSHTRTLAHLRLAHCIRYVCVGVCVCVWACVCGCVGVWVCGWVWVGVCVDVCGCVYVVWVGVCARYVHGVCMVCAWCV